MRPKPEAGRAMRAIISTLMLCGTVLAMGALPAAARDYPFCIRGCDFGGGPGDCIFSNYQQCQAAASGREASCAANPYFSADARPPTDRPRQSRRRF
jgi:hypothetical protein